MILADVVGRQSARGCPGLPQTNGRSILRANACKSIKPLALTELATAVCISSTLMAAAGQAMQQKNPGAVVACIRQLDHMTGTEYNSHLGRPTHHYRR